MRIVHLRSADYARRSGGWVYNTRLAAALAAQAGTFSEIVVPVAFPSIGAQDAARLAAGFAALPPDAILVSDHLHVAQLIPQLADRQFSLSLWTFMTNGSVLQENILSLINERPVKHCIVFYTGLWT